MEIKYVTKRDGKVVKFDGERIVNAIMAAMKDVGCTDPVEANKIATDIEKCANMMETVESVQDMVEMRLMKVAPKVARAYISYRNERTRKRRMQSRMMRKVKEKVFATNVVNANANVDEYSFGGRKNEAAGIIEKEIALEELLDPTVRQYREENLLYIHDFTEYPIGDHNCLFADIGKLTRDGFHTRNGGVRGARSFSTACQQVAVIFQIQSQCQYGGVGSAHIDYDLAPYVRISFLKHYKDGLKYCETKKSYDAFENRFGKGVGETASIDADLNIFQAYAPKAYRYAIDMLEKEGRQSCEALFHNLNTLESRPGSQLPFTSINYGLNTTFEGRCVTRWLLNASIEGIGEHHSTPIFPISIFQYKKGVNDTKFAPNYDLYNLAVKSLSKRIYPNIVNTDWSSNTPTEHPAQVDPTTFKETISGDAEVMVFFPVLALDGEMWSVKDLYKHFTADEVKGTNGVYKNVGWLNIAISDSKAPKYSSALLRMNNMRIEDNLELTMATILKVAKVGDNEYVIITDSKGYDYSEYKNVKYMENTSYNKICEAYDADTEMATMGCRTMIGFDRHGMGYRKTGRGNISPATMILPTLGIKYGICTGERTEPDVNGFFEALDDLLDVTVTSLLDRYEYICSQNIKAGYFMYENEDMADGKKAIEANDVEVSMKHGTLAIGFIGVANTCYAMFGEYHDQSERAFKFAERIVKRIYDYAAEMSEKHNLNFSCYATPAENSCYTICNALRREYGTIEGVTDKDYLTNSIHVPVSEKVSIYEKIDLEAKLAKYCTGGNITYVELESGVMNNPLAIRRIIDYAMNHNVGYLALNFPIDTCKDCGSSVGEFEEVCPVCGSHHIESLRRVTGYLTTDYRKFNKGKIAEVKDRFKHSKITTF
jgi:anaerobic ribonucleoside-triphosphate reductase